MSFVINEFGVDFERNETVHWLGSVRTLLNDLRTSIQRPENEHTDNVPPLENLVRVQPPPELYASKLKRFQSLLFEAPRKTIDAMIRTLYNRNNWRVMCELIYELYELFEPLTKHFVMQNVRAFFLEDQLTEQSGQLMSLFIVRLYQSHTFDRRQSLIELLLKGLVVAGENRSASPLHGLLVLLGKLCTLLPLRMHGSVEQAILIAGSLVHLSHGLRLDHNSDLADSENIRLTIEVLEPMLLYIQRHATDAEKREFRLLNERNASQISRYYLQKYISWELPPTIEVELVDRDPDEPSDVNMVGLDELQQSPPNVPSFASFMYGSSLQHGQLDRARVHAFLVELLPLCTVDEAHDFAQYEPLHWVMMEAVGNIIRNPDTTTYRKLHCAFLFLVCLRYAIVPKHG